MKNSEDDYYKQTTQTVRTSYRLLHDYQRLILDGCQYIGRQLNLTYIKGEPKFSTLVREHNTDLNNWSWDWLPFYTYEMAFIKGCDGVRVSLSMIHIADTSGHGAERHERTDTQKMGEASKSHSLIVFAYSTQSEGENSVPHLNTLDCCYPNDRDETFTMRNKFLDKCVLNAVKEKSFKQDGLCIMPVPVEEILTQDGANQVINRLKETFCSL